MESLYVLYLTTFKVIILVLIDGCVLSLVYKCEKGHGGVWYSSSVICEKCNQKVFVTPTLLSAAVLISGNNFDKVSELGVCVSDTFHKDTVSLCNTKH